MNISAMKPVVMAQPRFGSSSYSSLATEQQRQEYETVVREGIDASIKTLKKCPTGELNFYDGGGYLSTIPQVMGALHILNLVFPKTGNSFNPL